MRREIGAEEVEDIEIVIFTLRALQLGPGCCKRVLRQHSSCYLYGTDPKTTVG